MTSTLSRFDRNIRLFGEEGQRRLRAATVAVVGVGGNGTHVVQQLALLGVGRLMLIDDEELSESNRNRYIGAWHSDLVPGSKKTALGRRLAELIDPTTEVVEIPYNLMTEEAFAAIRRGDHVFGCLDHDGPRFVLNELCAAYAKPYIDLASDVATDGAYGGRVCVAWDGSGCLMCFGELDQDTIRRFLSGAEQRENEAVIYGIPEGALAEVGPSVVSINGVVASLAVTEYIVAVTGLRPPARFLSYLGHTSRVTVRHDPSVTDCYYCKRLRGQDSAANVERYVRDVIHSPSRDILPHPSWAEVSRMTLSKDPLPQTE
jgi:hypothetical protein